MLVNLYRVEDIKLRMKNKVYSCSGRLLTLQSSSSISMLIILFTLTNCNIFFIHMHVAQSKFEFVIIVS